MPIPCSVRADRASLYRVVKPFNCQSLAGRVPVTVVVPCFNEEEGLQPLADALGEIGDRWPQYDWRFLFVDDASTDATAELMVEKFSRRDDCAVLQHHENQGLTGAILTGLDYSQTEIVCSIDSDCTYDPRDLGYLVRMIESGNDLVTGSPYHPDGTVAGVPAWRLVLSKAASTLYRFAFRAHIYTFTACYRAYRREAVQQLKVENPRYGGLAEMLLLLMIDGGRVGEFPTTLQVRQFGQSKMKVLGTIGSHLSLMARLLPSSWAAVKPRALPIPVTVATLTMPLAAEEIREAAPTSSSRKAA